MALMVDLDYTIPCSENHLRHILPIWVLHYHTSRLYIALRPGIPQPPVSFSATPSPPAQATTTYAGGSPASPERPAPGIRA